MKGCWIWSQPGNNAIFCKLIEKAYLKYQLIYGKFHSIFYKDIKSYLNKIIFAGGFEREAMKILINSETQTIYDCDEDNIFMNYNEMFQEIVKLKNKNALITLARNFNFKNTKLKLSGHAYSFIGACEKGKENMKKQVLCIKNP